MDKTAMIAHRDHVISLVRSGDLGEFRAGFHDWFITHCDMWVDFSAAADKVWAAGIRNYSAFVIVNVLRYRANVRGTKFSMTNTFVPDIARLYNALRHPLFKTSTRFGKETS